MKTMTVGKLKAEFSDVLGQVKAGETIIVEYGRTHEKVAMLVPYTAEQPKRELGALKGKASFTLGEDFKMTEQELLGE